MERVDMSFGLFLIIIVSGVLYSRSKDKKLIETHDYDDEQSSFEQLI